MLIWFNSNLPENFLKPRVQEMLIQRRRGEAHWLYSENLHRTAFQRRKNLYPRREVSYNKCRRCEKGKRRPPRLLGRRFFGKVPEKIYGRLISLRRVAFS